MSKSGPSKENYPATEKLAGYAISLAYDDLPDAVVRLAKQCMLDWTAVTVAGAREYAVKILKDEILHEGGHPHSTIVYWGERVSRSQAALVNGFAAHTLDYDDGSSSARGHMTAPIAAAVLSLAESVHATGSQAIAAFVAGYETASMLGLAINVDRAYERGWHATSFVGIMGTAAACANLLALDVEQARHAIGIAATQASGMKCMFGTMCKPYQAGIAAERGLRSACLAHRGFTSCITSIEAEQGFAANFSGEEAFGILESWSKSDFHILKNHFKFHAACHLTHGAIEASLKIANDARFNPDRIDAVQIYVNPICLKVCNIREPQTGLEAKFSLSQSAAMALSGEDTTDIRTFSDENASRSDLVKLRQLITVEADENREVLSGRVVVKMKDGATLSQDVNLVDAEIGLKEQSEKLNRKYTALVTPLIGDERAEQLRQNLDRLESVVDVNVVTSKATRR